MVKKLDLRGQRFGRLIVIEQAEDHISPSGLRQKRWLCQCDCGNEKIAYQSSLTQGNTLSCGCFNRDKNKRIFTKHGNSKSKLYRVWLGMLNRCYRENIPAYSSYGARGIKVCDTWKNDFMSFYNWAYQNNYDEKATGNNRLTVDRIDVNGDYEPNNCRMATYKQQSNNTRRNVWLDFNGQHKTVSEWSELTGLTEETIRKRIKRGWNVYDTLTKPQRITKLTKMKGEKNE